MSFRVVSAAVSSSLSFPQLPFPRQDNEARLSTEWNEAASLNERERAGKTRESDTRDPVEREDESKKES